MSAPPPTNEQVAALSGLVDSGVITAEQASAVHEAIGRRTRPPTAGGTGSWSSPGTSAAV